ncbi:EAL domain-containing protein [Sporosarcina sp. PTS2304]|uniref:EAL domain-containing protein n=1 Tax=Sporosarcina sp. PTS2304 TaxID=2283194 RepID=UPI000E0D1577|nr:EAL domain-containing protein [Sporosarcina sp. PTS2304]AXI00369.1 EAL domain-containing protein [Sporosarcina sp. PTS2304]
MQEFLNGLEKFTGKDSEEGLKRILGDIAYTLEQAAIVSITDSRGIIQYANEHFEKLSKFPLEELIGAKQSIVNSGYHDASFFKNMWATIGRGDTWRGDICNLTKDGTYYWVDTTIVPFLNESNKPYQYVSIRYDITERKLMEEEIRKSAELYEIITANASDFIAIIDREGQFKYVSPSFEKLLGYELNSMSENTFYSLIDSKNRQKVERRVKQFKGYHRRTMSLEFTFQDVEGGSHVMEAKMNEVKDSIAYVDKLLVVMRDVTERVKSEEKIRHLVYNDQLTSLMNRNSFREQLALAFERARTRNQVFALVHMNIDRLRYANDLFGHEAGDYLLAMVGERLKHRTGPESLLARIAGDEFAFIVTGLTEESEIFNYAEEVRKYLEQPIQIGRQTYNLSISCGISIYPEHANQPSELVTKATLALGKVKLRGGGDSEMYEHGTSKMSLERILLENELRKSVQQQHFYLEYQPKVFLGTGELTGVEALVRWKHPDLGIIPPMKFIPLAEETKIIVPLGEWILREVCKQAQAEIAEGSFCRFAVNVSTVQIKEDGYVDSVLNIINEFGIPADMLELELTESSFMDTEGMKEEIQKLRNAGLSVAIDDFGTGYSTFSYIKELPADTLKIDMAFVRDILENENSQAIIKAIVTLADTAGLNVVAEGIEKKEQADMLYSLGCREGQGYYYGRPTILDEAKQRVGK